MSWLVRSLFALSAAFVASGADADICSSLQQQYLSAGSAGASSTTNLVALNNSLQIAEAAAQSNHCTGGGLFGLFGPSPSAACPQIMQQVRSLQSQIQQQYASSRGGGLFGGFFGAPLSPRDQIQQQLSAYGCPIPQPNQQYFGGGYKTLCVRTCDGYYFPVEYGVSSDRFQADAVTCQTLYGGPAQVQLFVMPTDGDVADAQPVNGGDSYSAQPYAYSYRTTLNSACVDQLQSGVNAVIAAAPPSGPASPGAASVPAPRSDPVPIPQLRADRFEDPETLANAAGDLHPLALPAAPPAIASQISASGIRVVGADYYNQILDQQALGPVLPTQPAPVSTPDTSLPAASSLGAAPAVSTTTP